MTLQRYGALSYLPWIFMLATYVCKIFLRTCVKNLYTVYYLCGTLYFFVISYCLLTHYSSLFHRLYKNVVFRMFIRIFIRMFFRIMRKSVLFSITIYYSVFFDTFSHFRMFLQIPCFFRPVQVDFFNTEVMEGRVFFERLPLCLCSLGFRSN